MSSPEYCTISFQEWCLEKKNNLKMRNPPATAETVNSIYQCKQEKPAKLPALLSNLLTQRLQAAFYLVPCICICLSSDQVYNPATSASGKISLCPQFSYNKVQLAYFKLYFWLFPMPESVDLKGMLWRLFAFRTIWRRQLLVAVSCGEVTIVQTCLHC